MVNGAQAHLTIRTDRTDSWLYDTHALNINAVIFHHPSTVVDGAQAHLTIRTDRTVRWPFDTYALNIKTVIFLSLPNDMQYTIRQLWSTKRKHT